MEQQQQYRERLAALDQAVANARLEPALLVERAAGLLAGRVGCRVDEAHAYLLRRASDEGRSLGVLAGEVLAALDGRGGRSRRPDAAMDKALRPVHQPAARTVRPAPGPADAAFDWARVVQQVLDTRAGNHLALRPVRGDAGEIVDFVIVAASPDVVDFSGRRGPQLVGRRIHESYPTVPDSPVWQAWLDVLADGQPREVGPFPYVGATDRSPTDVLITARVHPLGPGVLSSWVRHEEETRLAERIARTERLGHLGWGEADLVSGRTVWSEELYRIYERDPALGPLSSEEQAAVTLPEDEPIRRQAAEAFGRGEAVDVATRIRVGDRIKYVRSVADAERDLQGRPVKVYGIVQDVTAQETSRAQLAEAEQLLREHEQDLAAEHQLAAQLQQIVLPIPAEPFDLAGLRVAVRYLPAEESSRVGGDWFHAAAADDGGVVLAVGDVAGHGIQAATVMAHLRHMLAGLAVTTTTDPAELLWHLNRLLYTAGHTATIVAARYDAATSEVVWAQAGHPAPLHTRDGVTTVLDRPRGTLLGADRDSTYDRATLSLVPGDLLLFYTDGLIEHPKRTLEEGRAPVIAALNRISTSGSQQPLADLLSQLHRSNPDDDTCILAVRHQMLGGSVPGAADG